MAIRSTSAQGIPGSAVSLKVFHLIFVSVAGLFLALFALWAFLFAPGPAVALGVAATAALAALIVAERRVLASLPRRPR